MKTVTKMAKKQKKIDKPTNGKSLRKSKRASVQRQAAKKNVSSSFYVGYVEDNESVANIMKKFKKLEALKEEKKDNSSGSSNQDLTEADMEKLFYQTSAFNMQKVLNDEYYFEDEEDFVDSDEEFDTQTSSKRKRSRGRSFKDSKYKNLNYTVLPTGNLPMSWGKTINTYVPQNAIHTQTSWKDGEITNYDVTLTPDIPQSSKLKKVKKVVKLDLRDIARGRKGGFEGILISARWKERLGNQNNDAKGILPEDLLGMNLNSKVVMQAGFVYIWTPKHYAVRVLEVMKEMNFFYVENGIIVRNTTANKADLPKDKQYKAAVFNVSHELLLIFRKGIVKPSGKREWTKVEIRHQRTTDVAFGYFSDDNEYTYSLDYAYNLIETMIPLGRYNPGSDESGTEKDSGRLLHLWAHPTKQRTGWLHISE